MCNARCFSTTNIITLKRRNVTSHTHICCSLVLYRWTAGFKWFTVLKLVNRSVVFNERSVFPFSSGTSTFKISNCRPVLNAVCCLLGNSPAYEFYMPTFRNTVFHLHRWGGVKCDWGCEISNLVVLHTQVWGFSSQVALHTQVCEFSNPVVLHTQVWEFSSQVFFHT